MVQSRKKTESEAQGVRIYSKSRSKELLSDVGVKVTVCFFCFLKVDRLTSVTSRGESAEVPSDRGSTAALTI